MEQQERTAERLVVRRWVGLPRQTITYAGCCGSLISACALTMLQPLVLFSPAHSRAASKTATTRSAAVRPEQGFVRRERGCHIVGILPHGVGSPGW